VFIGGVGFNLIIKILSLLKFMLLSNRIHLIYKFIIRWGFSTNHKCGVKASFIPGVSVPYWNVVTVKPVVIHLKDSKRIKQTIKVIPVVSLGKRTFIMASSIRGVGYLCNVDKGKWVYLNILFCGGKRLHIDLNFFSVVRNDAVVSQGLEETYTGRGCLKYNYESGFACLGKRSGRYRKPLNLNNSLRNVVPLPNTKRDFSTGGSHEFKKLIKHNGKYVNPIEVLADVNFLQGAYQKIKSNQGVMAKGSGVETLDSLDYNWFCTTSKRLLDGSFQFRPARRIMIPKPNKPEERPLTISNSRDKIVQQAMKMVLEIIYDGKFLDTSHGFRPSRGCHSALEMIRLHWTGISWFLEFDVEKCYDNIDRHRLTNILKEDIDDQRFLDLIYKLFNAGVVGWKEGLGPDPSKGISQGSVLSPVLSNIYLHKLDVEVAKITEEYQKGKIRRFFREVLNAERRVHRKKDFKRLSPEQQAAIMSKHRAERRKMGVTMTDWNDPNFIRVRYVRYVDDLLLGIAGPKELVVKIRDRLVTFVKSDLKLNLTGGEITHIGAGKIKFLGMMINGVPWSKFPRRFGKRLEKIKRVKNRIKLQKEIREERELKVVRTVLRKALKGASKVVDKPAIKSKVLALSEWANRDHDCSKEVVNTYRQFFEAIIKTMIFVPDELKETLGAAKRAIDKWEKDLSLPEEDPKKRYKELVGRYDALPIQINAPLVDIRFKLRDRGIISKSNKPRAIGRLIHVPDDKIVSWYRAVGRGLLSYYSCCQNFYVVKNYVDYFVRWSAIHTLAGKHKSSCKKIIAKHSKDLIIKDKDDFILASFMSSQEIKTTRRQFRSNVSQDAVEKVLNQIWAKFTRTNFFGAECAVKGCENPKIEWHHVDKLSRMKDHFGNISVVTKKGRRVSGIDAFKVAFNRKQIPLCKMHHISLHQKKISFQHLDWEYIK
jgi:group II intron reverse transcriptase/maturase